MHDWAHLLASNIGAVAAVEHLYHSVVVFDFRKRGAAAAVCQSVALQFAAAFLNREPCCGHGCEACGGFGWRVFKAPIDIRTEFAAYLAGFTNQVPN
jgi:hypothetical protein